MRSEKAARGVTRLAYLDQAKAQPTAAGPARKLNGQFAPGTSGNPSGHKAFATRQELINRHALELEKALRDELGNKLTAIDLAFASSAARMLARAAYSEKQRVHLTTKASHIIERLRERYPSRSRHRLPTLGEVLRGKK